MKASFVGARLVGLDAPTVLPFGLARPPALAREHEVLLVVHPTHEEAFDLLGLIHAVPAADTLAAGTHVAVLETAREREGLVSRLLPRRRVAKETACAALLARGYVDVRAEDCPVRRASIVLGTASPERAG